MHLKRYFCKLGDEDKIIRDDVFILSRELYLNSLGQEEKRFIPRSWEDYQSAKSIILLGPPRHGKTTEFSHQYKNVVNGFFLPLGEIPTQGNQDAFEQAITDLQKWKEWRVGSEDGELFIDALDEGKLTTRQMIRNLSKWLKSLGEPTLKRLRVHLSCRGADWDRADRDSWVNLFQFSGGEREEKGREGGEVVPLTLLDLARSQYEEYCQAEGVDPDQFYEDLPPRAKRFVARPQTLTMLIEDYKQTGKPPDNLFDLYERIIRRRIKEENPEHERARVYSTPEENKYNISSLYAAVTILSDRPLIGDLQDDSNKHVPLGLSKNDGDDEMATFLSGLFRSPIHGQYRFDDPGLSEYLGAKYINKLIDRNAITPSRVFQLFLGNFKDQEPVPKLRGIMVWLCAINSKFRQLTIQTNPGVLLDEYPGDLDSKEKLLIWSWMVDRYGSREFFEYRQLMNGCGAIACPEIIPNLQEVLEQPAKYGEDLRILALQIAIVGKLTGLVQTIEQCCQEVSNDSYFFIFASEVLGHLNPDRIRVLRHWLNLPAEIDPKNYLLGRAMEALWPQFITIEEVIGHLSSSLKREDGDGLSSFMAIFAKNLTLDQRELVIETLMQDLEILLKNSPDGRAKINEHRPSQWIMYFLVPHLIAFKDESTQLSKLERWLSVVLKIERKNILNLYATEKELMKLLEEDRILRHALTLKHIERIFNEKGTSFDPQKFYLGESFVPRAEDLQLWKKTLLEWMNWKEKLVEVVWECLWNSWGMAQNKPDLIDWFESLANRNAVIDRLWNKYRICKLPEGEHYWQRDQAIRNKNRKIKLQKHIQFVQNNLTKIRAGDEYFLSILFDSIRSSKNTIEEEYGNEVGRAYQAGLLNLWRSLNLPPMASYYTSNTIPFKIILILEAVLFWKRQTSEKWVDLPEEMRRSALQAGFSSLNKFPEWYIELANVEKESFKEFAFEALKLETDLNSPYPQLAHRLKFNRQIDLFREIAFEWLNQYPMAGAAIVLTLAEALAIDNPKEEIIDFLWNLGRQRLILCGYSSGLRILTLVWRYRPEQVEEWVPNALLYLSKEKRFTLWIESLTAMHVRRPSSSWPAWVKPKSLIIMVPDLYEFYPPNTDPTIDEYNNGNSGVYHRHDLARLRNDALAKIAESGSTDSGNFLSESIADPKWHQYRDIFLYYFDIWQRASAEQGWQPLAPKDLVDYLNKGQRPIRNHSELFELLFEIIKEIQAEMEGGQSNLKRLCWNYKNQTKLEPADETDLQIVLTREIKRHPLLSNIISNREVSVTDENHPDIKVETKLESNHSTVVYIEVKRQMNNGLFTAIESQLADKYLIDPEARYGFYFVGWYGDDAKYWKVSQKERLESCGVPVRKAKGLENCLQKQADKIVEERDDIDGIKVAVVDLS